MKMDVQQVRLVWDDRASLFRGGFVWSSNRRRDWIRISALLSVFMSCASAAFSDDNKVPLLSVEAKVAILSKYVRNGELVSGKPVAQTDVTVSHNSGAYGGFLHSVGIDGTGPNSDFGDELGLYLGWRGEIYGFTLDVGLVYFDFYPLMNWLNNAYGPYVEIRRALALNSTNTVTFFVKNELYVMSGKAEFEGGNYIIVGVEHAWDVSSKVSFAQEALIVHSDGAFGGVPGDSWQCTGSFTVKLSNALKVSVASIQFSAPITSRNEQFQVVVGAGLTSTF